MNPSDFRLLYYFVEIAKAGSIRSAARHLRLSPAVVSTALADLEAALSVTLISRTTRKMQLTEAGRIMFDKAALSIKAVEDAMQPLGKETAEVRGRVSLTVPTELASSWLPPLLIRFKQLHPAVETAIHADDIAMNLGGSDHDISLRTEFDTEPRQGPDIVAVFPLELVCESALLPSLPEGLQDRLHRLAFIGSQHQITNGMLFATELKSARITMLKVNPEFTIDNRQVALELARKGLGAALLISISTSDDLESGKLARLTDDHGFGYVVVSVVMRDPLPSSAAVAMREFLLSCGQDMHER